MADVKDPKIAEGEHESWHAGPPSRTAVRRITAENSDSFAAYEKVRDHKDDTTWLLLDYEVGDESISPRMRITLVARPSPCRLVSATSPVMC